VLLVFDDWLARGLVVPDVRKKASHV